MLREPVDQLVGKTLGNYSIEQLLGHGELEAVYKVRHYKQERPVMMTAFLIPEEFSLSARERFLARFLHESARIVQLRHPNLVPYYDFGEDAGYPYLVSPFVKGNSLANLLREQGRFHPERTLDILTQVAAALDHAHGHRVVHGSLSPTNILLDEQHRIQVARLGFLHLLGMHGIQQSNQPYAQRFGIAGIPPSSVAYAAPECAEEQAVDFRIDIYALGTTIFELLSGELPFANTGPPLKKMQHTSRTMSLLHTIHPDIPATLDPVIQQALERDPAQRFRSASEMARAFEGALKAPQKALPIAPTTPLVSMKLPMKLQHAVELQTSASVKDRRRIVAMIAGVGIITTGVGVAAMNLPHLMKQMTQDQLPGDEATTSTSLTQDPSNTSHATQGASKGPQPMPTAKPTSTATPRPDSRPTTVAQSPPIPSSPIPTPTPSHTGTIIGFTNQPIDTANGFINPADGSSSTLIHLPNGSFVAYEKACTHQGVPVRYDPDTHKLVCPMHHAIFDPAHSGRVVEGPARRALPGVTIHVNANGTITTG